MLTEGRKDNIQNQVHHVDCVYRLVQPALAAALLCSSAWLSGGNYSIALLLCIGSLDLSILSSTYSQLDLW